MTMTLAGLSLLTKPALRKWRNTCYSFYFVKLVLFGTFFFLKFIT